MSSPSRCVTLPLTVLFGGFSAQLDKFTTVTFTFETLLRYVVDVLPDEKNEPLYHKFKFFWIIFFLEPN